MPEAAGNGQMAAARAAATIEMLKGLVMPLIMLLVGIWGGYNASRASAYDTFATHEEVRGLQMSLTRIQSDITAISVSIAKLEATKKAN